jgi:uncharacterized protein
MSKARVVEKIDNSIEEKLRALYELQQIDSKIDKIRTIRGELPLEVSDLEDEIEGLQTRLNKLTEELNAMEDSIVERKNATKEAQTAIKKYTTQQSKVRNNREYDSLTKELEFQNLEIQLNDKKIKEAKASIAMKNEIIEQSQKKLNERKNDLKHKKNELDDIIAETEKEEKALIKKSKQDEAIIEERLLAAYKKIRTNARNGLGVVAVERGSCGGCFNNIPPQRQLDIKTHKKIIVCEYCGRILVDAEILALKQE